MNVPGDVTVACQEVAVVLLFASRRLIEVLHSKQLQLMTTVDCSRKMAQILGQSSPSNAG